MMLAMPTHLGATEVLEYKTITSDETELKQIESSPGMPTNGSKLLLVFKL